MDYALLSRCSIQSTSDQEEYDKYAQISANAATAVAPEQAAVWSYPLMDGDREETIFNMVNTMLLRMHQSGHLAKISQERFALVKEGIACYKQMREDIRDGLPYWPLGLAQADDSWLAYGVKAPKKAGENQQKFYLSVWRRGGEADTCSFSALPEKYRKLQEDARLDVRQIYPQEEAEHIHANEDHTMTVTFEKPVMARLFELDITE